MSLIAVKDFSGVNPEVVGAWSVERSRWCCERLEDGDILWFEALPFDLPDADQKFLLSQEQRSSALHKNVSYRPEQDKLRGFTSESREDLDRLHQIMRNYSAQVTGFLSRLLSPYAPHWKLDFASFRLLEEQGRTLPLHKRNDLLHVDAFPSRPTRGARILRCFTNLNPSQSRKWLVGERFPELAKRYAEEAGLARMAERANPSKAAWHRGVTYLKRTLGMRAQHRSAYDEFMLRFHDYLKERTDFQQDSSRIQADFPPLSSWIVFTDAVPHAVVSGRFALEQTFIVPLSALIKPENSPLRTLEGIAGQQLVA
jgi:hypothetical protein